MNRQAKSNTLLSLFALLTVLVAGAACGGATDSEPSEEFNETTEEFGEFEQEEPNADSQEIGESSSNESSSNESTAPVASNPTAFLSQSNTRALWVWSESPGAEALIENSGGAGDEFFDFLAAPHGEASRSINRILFEARQYSNVDRFSKVRQASYDPITDPSKQDSLRGFLKRAKSEGVAVEYLDGQAIWVASDANAEAPKQLCRDIVAFNKGTNDPAERFDGIHLDIEPHTVREGPYAGQWWENRLPGGYNAEWTERWKGILNSCRATIDEYTAETGHRIVLASDLGTDYAYYNKPIYEFLNRPDGPLDYLGIMNYFDNRPNRDGDPSYFYGDSEGEEITGGVIENLDSWDRLPVMFGVETGPESIAQDWQSFWQEGRAAMYSTIDTLMTDYNAENMIGVAIHHYGPKSYVGLKN